MLLYLIVIIIPGGLDASHLGLDHRIEVERVLFAVVDGDCLTRQAVVDLEVADLAWREVKQFPQLVPDPLSFGRPRRLRRHHGCYRRRP